MTGDQSGHPSDPSGPQVCDQTQQKQAGRTDEGRDRKDTEDKADKMAILIFLFCVYVFLYLPHRTKTLIPTKEEWRLLNSGDILAAPHTWPYF